jgi:Trk K+ transport system NAD-binding subunit
MSGPDRPGERERFVVAGASRLTRRVVRLLDARGAHVVVVSDAEAEFVTALPAKVEVVEDKGDRADALARGRIAGATCLLALADDDVDNLKTAVCAASVAPDVPVVLRAFEPSLADELEATARARRAYSVSALAAPAFVAAALGEDVVETLRLGRDDVTICRLSVRTHSPVVDQSAADLESASHCVVLAHRRSGAAWEVGSPAGPAGRVGDELVLGGELHDVLRTAVRNRGPVVRRRPRSLLAPPRERTPSSTLVPAASVALVLVFLVSTIVFAVKLDLHGVDALYAAFTTGWGNPDLADRPAWLQLFGVGVMIAVGALVGVLFSHLAAKATAERLDVRAARRAARSADHVVVAGLGTVGYRVERLLHDLGLETVVLERDEGSRFAPAVNAHAPVLVGDASLPENLERAGIRAAACLVAVTGDDLVNLSACLHARRLNPKVRTVARLFDDTLVEHAGDGLGVDAVLSASRIASAAFVGAATDERAVRRFAVDGLELAAVRVKRDAAAQATAPVRTLAVDPLRADAILAGPAALLDALVR